MSQKTILKRGISAIVAIAFVIAPTMGFAESTVTHSNTITTYIAGNSTMVHVRSTFTGAVSGDQITYLAYDVGDDLYAPDEPVGDGEGTESNIVFIDQKTAEGSNVVFSYNADMSKIGRSVVKFGTIDREQPALLANPFITVYKFNNTGISSVNGWTNDPTLQETTVSAAGNKYTVAVSSVAGDNTTTLTINAGTNKRLNGVRIGPILITDLIPQGGSVYNVTLPAFYEDTEGDKQLIYGDQSSVQILTADEDALPSAGTAKDSFKSLNNDPASANEIVVLVKDVVLPAGADDPEYGIFFSHSQTVLGNLTATDANKASAEAVNVGNGELESTAVKYAAKAETFFTGANSTLAFAIGLKDGGSDYLAEKNEYYVRPYLKVGANVYYGATLMITK